MRLFAQRGGVPADVVARAGLPRGEKVLAGARSVDGSWVLGSRTRLILLPGPDSALDGDRSIPWEQVEDASWDTESATLRVTEIGEYGEQRPAYALEMAEPALLLQLLRERVTASIVLQRRVPVRGRAGVTVIARRSPVGGQVRWMHAYDPGLDPDDPDVRAVAEAALRQAQGEVGDPI